MLLELRDSGYNNNVKDVYIRNDKNVLKIFYGDNGDLYFDIFGDRKVNNDGFNYIDMSDILFPFFKLYMMILLNVAFMMIVID